MYRKILLWLGKVALSGCLTLAILTGLCFFYYNVPVHYTCADGATDYKWIPNHFYSRGTEGFAWGKTNNDGYLNAFDYYPDMPVSVLIMGSSHMEAYQMAMGESAAGRLDAALNGKTVYNIGTSGHTLMTCVGNLKAAVGKYKPQDYVVIETASTSFSNDDLTLALNGQFPEQQSHEGGIIGLLQRVPYLRLLYSQLKGMRNTPVENEAASAPATPDVPQNDPVLLGQLCKKITTDANTRGGGYTPEIVILYHPPVKIEPDGTLTLDDDREQAAAFGEICETNGIHFLDMGARFLRKYEENHLLPYGFANSPVGSGHLNRYGHAMAADELYKLMEGVG